LWISFEKSFVGFSQTLLNTVFHNLFASITGGYVAYLFLQLLDDVLNINTLVGIFLQGFIAGVLGLIVWVIVLKILDNPEIGEVWKTMHQKIWRVRPVVSEEMEL
jgi:ABC-type Co2+ transport system permease subunit